MGEGCAGQSCTWTTARSSCGTCKTGATGASTSRKIPLEMPRCQAGKRGDLALAAVLHDPRKGGFLRSPGVVTGLLRGDREEDSAGEASGEPEVEVEATGLEGAASVVAGVRDPRRVGTLKEVLADSVVGPDRGQGLHPGRGGEEGGGPLRPRPSDAAALRQRGPGGLLPLLHRRGVAAERSTWPGAATMKPRLSHL